MSQELYILWGKYNNEDKRKGHVHLGFASLEWKMHNKQMSTHI